MLPAKRPTSWQVAELLSGSPRKQWECCNYTWRREGLEHLWPMKEPWLKECACCLFQLAKWSISNTQSIMHAAKCSHRMATCDLKTLLSRARTRTCQKAKGHQWAPAKGLLLHPLQATPSPSSHGLGRAVYAKPAQRDHMKATRGRNDYHSGLWVWRLTCQNGQS